MHGLAGARIRCMNIAAVAAPSPISLRGLSSMATRALLADLVREAADPGVQVGFESVGGVDAARRVAAGEACDLVVLAGDAIARLQAAGAVLPGSRVDLVRSAMAVAVPAGRPHPDIDSEASLLQAVAEASTLGYSTGPSGDHLLALLERWGLRQRLAARLVQAPPGVPVAALVARGEVALGFQQLSELRGVDGVDVVGLLPPGAEYVTVFAGAVAAASTAAQAAQQWLQWAASPATEALKRRHGMTPV